MEELDVWKMRELVKGKKIAVVLSTGSYAPIHKGQKKKNYKHIKY